MYIPRIQAAIDRFGDRFLQKIYTAEERRTCWRWPKPGEAISPLAAAAWKVQEPSVRGAPTPEIVARLAGRWAAKEAIVKALGTGWRGVGYTEVEVIQSASGQPSVALHGRAITLAAALGSPPITWALSLSHDHDYATATAILFCPATPSVDGASSGLAP